MHGISILLNFSFTNGDIYFETNGTPYATAYLITIVAYNIVPQSICCVQFILYSN